MLSFTTYDEITEFSFDGPADDPADDPPAPHGSETAERARPQRESDENAPLTPTHSTPSPNPAAHDRQQQTLFPPGPAQERQEERPADNPISTCSMAGKRMQLSSCSQ